MDKVEKVNWNPMGRSNHKRSISTDIIRAMKIGDCLRVEHADMECKVGTFESKNNSCSLNQVIHRLRKQGWRLEAYHERQNVIVIRRLG